MKNLTENDLKSTLSEVIKPKDKIIWIPSAIWTFGPRFASPINEIGPRILNTILDFIGKNRTLIISSYTSAFSSNHVYDLVKSKPETGLLPNLALEHSSFQRSHNPINNYLVTGPNSQDILSRATQVFWSDGGLMGWAEENNIRICMIGVPWHEGCSQRLLPRRQDLPSASSRLEAIKQKVLAKASAPSGKDCLAAL